MTCTRVMFKALTLSTGRARKHVSGTPVLIEAYIFMNTLKPKLITFQVGAFLEGSWHLLALSQVDWEWHRGDQYCHVKIIWMYLAFSGNAVRMRQFNCTARIASLHRSDWLTVYKRLHSTLISSLICDHPWQNQLYCAWNCFWNKATITKHGLWSAAGKNLKSVAHVVLEIWAKMYPDSPY